MQYGQTPCQMAGVPKDWAAGHRWSSDWKDVTCQDCLRGKDEVSTFTLGQDGKVATITCKRCNRTSYNGNDVRFHYCSYCDFFHDDLWPPARHWWMEHPERDLAILKCDCGYWIGYRWKHLISTETNGVVVCPKCHADLFERFAALRTHYHEAHKTH